MVADSVVTVKTSIAAASNHISCMPWTQRNSCVPHIVATRAAHSAANLHRCHIMVLPAVGQLCTLVNEAPLFGSPWQGRNQHELITRAAPQWAQCATPRDLSLSTQNVTATEKVPIT